MTSSASLPWLRLRKAQTLDEMLPILLDETLVAFSAAGGGIWLYDAASNELRQTVTSPQTTQMTRAIRPGEGIVGSVFVTGETHLSREFASDPRTHPDVRLQTRPGWGGACVPIRTAERKQAAEDLKRWAGELERRNHEITLLNKMGELFHSCLTIDEASAVVASLMPRLFPEARGGLYLMRASRNLVERVAQWGAQPTRPINPGFTPDECWALRLGHAHLVEETASGLVCPHLDWPWPASFLCVPMIAQGDLMGLLHLQRGSASEATPSVPDRFKGSEQGLAVTVAEHIALALSNLRLRETLRGQSIRDSLTGLFNRRYLEETLEREARRAERGHYPIGILVLDIDYFKRYNDTYGHAAGDAVLKAVGAFLKNHTRSADIACRYGGEEFVLVFPEATLEDACQRAEELRQGVQQIEIQHNEQMLDRITLSIGVAAFPQHGSNVETPIQADDAALYAAKSAGRDRVILA